MLFRSMKLMSNEGVSSVAIIEEENGSLLSAVSVHDIGKVSASFSVVDLPLTHWSGCGSFSKQADPHDAAEAPCDTHQGMRAVEFAVSVVLTVIAGA